jgi:hypothetical protein
MLFGISTFAAVFKRERDSAIIKKIYKGDCLLWVVFRKLQK